MAEVGCVSSAEAVDAWTSGEGCGVVEGTPAGDAVATIADPAAAPRCCCGGDADAAAVGGTIIEPPPRSRSVLRSFVVLRENRPRRPATPPGRSLRKPVLRRRKGFRVGGVYLSGVVFCD